MSVDGTIYLLEFSALAHAYSYIYIRSVRKVYSHFEYLENRLLGLDVTWQPVRGDLTVYP
jgi:hypothetical protein